jgi:hypothetical protein
MKPELKPPGTKHLKLKCDALLSTFAFKFNLRRYSLASTTCEDAAMDKRVDGAGRRVVRRCRLTL